MRHVVALILVVVVLVLQETLAPRIALWDVRPELMVILVVELAFRLPGLEAMVWPWAAGLLTDLHEGGPVGVLAFTFGLSALIIMRLREFFFTESFFVRIIASAAGVVVTRVALAISGALRGQAPGFMDCLKELVVGTLYTAALAVVVLPLLTLALGRVLPRRERG